MEDRDGDPFASEEEPTLASEEEGSGGKGDHHPRSSSRITFDATFCATSAMTFFQSEAPPPTWSSRLPSLSYIAKLDSALKIVIVAYDHHPR